MFKTATFAAAFATALLAIAPAQATTLSFDRDSISFFSSVDEQGYTATTLGTNGYQAAIANTYFCGPACPDNGSTYILAHGAGIKLASSSGNAFSLTGFDGAEAHGQASGLWARGIMVTGYLAGGGTVSQSFALDWLQDGPGAGIDFQAFTLSGFDNLSYVTFTNNGGGSFFSLDNIKANDVPEPASLALLGLGLAGLGAARRKRG